MNVLHKEKYLTNFFEKAFCLFFSLTIQIKILNAQLAILWHILNTQLKLNKLHIFFKYPIYEFWG